MTPTAPQQQPPLRPVQMSAKAPATPPPPPAPPRMTIGSITRGKVDGPKRVTVYGIEGVGKTTFAASAPNPIIVPAERGTDHLDVARFPKPESWKDVFEAIDTLTNEKHDFQTVVFDTLDAIEPMLWSFMVRRDSTTKRVLTDIESYGFMKGYDKALDDWRVFLSRLERLQAQRQMNIILLAHCWVKTFKNPRGDDYDRYQMKVHAKAAALIREWSDATLFAAYETYANKDDRTQRVRGVSTGERLLFTQFRAAYDAKNRYSLPEQLPLSWQDFEAAAKEGRVATPEQLRAEIQRKAKDLGGDVEKAILETVTKAGDNANSLAIINNRVNVRLAEMIAAAQAAEGQA